LFSLSIWLHLFVLLKVNPYCHVYGRKVSSVGQWSIGWSCTRSIEYIRNDTKYFCQAQIQLKRGEVIGYKGGKIVLGAKHFTYFKEKIPVLEKIVQYRSNQCIETTSTKGHIWQRKTRDFSMSVSSSCESTRKGHLITLKLTTSFPIQTRMLF
jgi:hypothetical protein